MKFKLCRNEKGTVLQNGMLATAKIPGSAELEAHAENGVLAILPARMTAMEMLRANESLIALAASQLSYLEKVCGPCDHCGDDGPCELVTKGVSPAIRLPMDVLEAAGISSDEKLCYVVDDENNIRVVPAEYRYDLSDLSQELLQLFQRSGTCLDRLEELLMTEEVVYGA